MASVLRERSSDPKEGAFPHPFLMFAENCFSAHALRYIVTVGSAPSR